MSWNGPRWIATERPDNVPGLADGIKEAEFADQLRRQVARFGVEMLRAQDVIRFHRHDNYSGWTRPTAPNTGPARCCWLPAATIGG